MWDLPEDGADEPFYDRVPTVLLNEGTPPPTHGDLAAAGLPGTGDALRDFLDRSNEPQFVHQGGLILFVNAATVSYLGSPGTDRLLGRDFLDFVDRADRERVRAWLARVGAAPSEPSPRARIVRAGKAGIAQFLSRAVEWEGEPAFLILIHDVTEHVQAEAFRARLSAIVESSPDAILTTDLRGRIEDWNPGAERLFGYQCAEVKGRSVSILFPPDRKREFEMGLECVRDGRPFSVAETTRLRKGGHAVFVSATVSPVHDGSGQPVRAATILRDITERKAAQDALRRSESDLRSFYDNAPFMMGIAERDTDGVRVVSANAAFTGLGAAGQALARWIEDYGDHTETGGPRRLARTVDAGGLERALSVTVAPIPGGEGAPRFCFIAEDVTEQEKLKQRLQISDRMSSFGTLAAGVGHEINNPLAAVMANVEFAMERLVVARATPPPDVVDALRDAREGLERVRRIVRDLKTFSRPDETKLEAVDLRQVLESVINMAWNEIRHRARLVKDYGDAPLVDGNASRLGQVFLNLVVNAAQAIPEGAAGRNEIRIVTGRDASGRASVEIRDSGAGMDARLMSRIFEPFFTTKPVGVGTGLGLSIVHGIVTGMGGEISVDSRPGRGTTFRILLPASATPAVAPASAGSPSPVRRARILLIDDEPAVCTSVSRLLGRDHEVTVAGSGKEALGRLRAGESYDVVLCDMMMPEMTGADVHAELGRAFPAVAEAMVFMTGGAFTPSSRTFLDSVPNQRIEKPFDAAALRSVIAERLRQPTRT